MYYYVDEQGKNTGFDGVFTKIDMCRKHYTEVGLGADYVDSSCDEKENNSISEKFMHALMLRELRFPPLLCREQY
jgi:hypothetical protein